MRVQNECTKSGCVQNGGLKWMPENRGGKNARLKGMLENGRPNSMPKMSVPNQRMPKMNVPNRCLVRVGTVIATKETPKMSIQNEYPK